MPASLFLKQANEHSHPHGSISRQFAACNGSVKLAKCSHKRRMQILQTPVVALGLVAFGGIMLTFGGIVGASGCALMYVSGHRICSLIFQRIR
jgi:energy-converting hydrogenase Eha subunit G